MRERKVAMPHRTQEASTGNMKQGCMWTRCNAPVTRARERRTGGCRTTGRGAREACLEVRGASADDRDVALGLDRNGDLGVAQLRV